MLAYHSNPAVKAKFLHRVQVHRLADELVQGTGWADGKGCAVGCTLERYEHDQYPIELGVPEILAHLEDTLFELIPCTDKAAWSAWPERFLAAIRPGADLAGVWPAWAIWSLTDPQHGVIRHAAGFPDCESAIMRVAELWRTGGTPDQFSDAADAADRAARAAWAAAWAARAAGAADAADAAADAARAADAAEAAAAADARAAAARAAGAAAWTKAACDKLISLLEAA